MALIELAENAAALGGKFTPKANQKKHVSFFVVYEGPVQEGWMTMDELVNEGLNFPHIRRRLTGFSEYKDPKTGPNRFKHKGMMMTEVIGSREDFEAKQLLEEQASQQQIDATTADAETDKGGIRGGEVKHERRNVNPEDLALPGE